MATNILRYPPDNHDYFTTLFSCIDNGANDRGEVHIALPMPSTGVGFSDGGQYGEIDVGALTQGTVDAVSGNIPGLKASITLAGETAVTSLTPAQLRRARGDNTLIAPNTNTNFTNNNMRSFTFTYKLSARNSNESTIINNIDQIFRELVYASNKNQELKVLLQFPPTWEIKFLQSGDSVSENPYIPKIATCYLTSYNSTINASGNLFHVDGQPTEVDMSLTFQETRVLTREDINELHGRERGEVRSPDNSSN